MSWCELVLRGLRWRWVPSLLNTLGVALGVGAVCVVLLVQADVQARFEEPGRSFGLVVGAPGSTQQLVLNAVFHLDESPGVIPVEVWRELSVHRSVSLVVPYAVGDSFRGHRVVATTDAFFDPRFPHPAGNRPSDKVRVGRPLRYDAAIFERNPGEQTEREHHKGGLREAVVGAEVSEREGLRVGDRIELAHGLDDGAMAHEREVMWEVVGILKRTETALDRVVLINLDSFFTIDEHAEGERGLSALLVFPRRGVHTAVLMGELRRRSDLQVAHVGTEVRRLLALIGNVDALILLVAQLVLVVAVLSVFSSTYLALHARRGQLGILRALGLPRRSILMLVVAEASLLAFVGSVLGCVAAHVVLYLGGDTVQAAVGFHPNPWRFVWAEGIAVGLVTAAGALAGVLPGIQAYRVDVATSLRDGD